MVAGHAVLRIEDVPTGKESKLTEKMKGVSVVGLLSALALIVLLITSADVGGADPPPRVGFAEEFDSFEGWEPRRNWPHGEPFEQVEVKDGVTSLTTHCGALNHRMVREDWPEWPKKPYPGFVTVTKTYEGEVDFDRYRKDPDFQALVEKYRQKLMGKGGK